MTAAAVNYAEAARFILTGIVSTLGSMAAVWSARLYLAYETALLVGIMAGVMLSFSLSKWFAFKSRSWQGAPSEAARFLLVYAVGCAMYWWTAVKVSQVAESHGGSVPLAEAAGVLGGGGIMAVGTYLGHRFFTYRTY